MLLATNEPTAIETAALVRRRERSAVEVTEAALGRIEATDAELRAYITVDRDGALAAAREVDRRIAAGDPVGALAGVPIAVKDNLSTAGLLTTCGSRILENYVPVFDATVVAKLRAAGAVIVGKTNLDEFAMGSSTENSGFFPTRNPWDLDRVPGGSSGGSAVAVASGTVPISLGSETGGSVRLPASFCGVVGLKPTYGRVSRYGLVAFGLSLDQVGPFGRTVADTALLLREIAGHDACDSTTLDAPVPDYLAELEGGVRGLRLGVPREYFTEGIEPRVEATIRAAIRQLEGLGARVDEVSMPHTRYGVAAYYLIAPAEASANLARYDGVKYGLSLPGADIFNAMERTREAGFGPEVKRRIMLGTYALSAGYYDAYYLKAQRVRTLMKRDFDAAFEQFDALLAPVAPVVAFPLGAKVDDPLAMYLIDVFTIPVNVAGCCALSVPAGEVDDLPVGLHVIGRPLGESTILRIAHAFEQDRLAERSG